MAIMLNPSPNVYEHIFSSASQPPDSSTLLQPAGIAEDRLKSDVRGYDNTARRAPWFVLVDLDRDKSLEPAEDCAPVLRREWLPNPTSGMCLRVAVRAMEAWLLADAETLAEFLHVPHSRIPGDPEALDNPKRQIVNLASRSNHPAIRRDMIPREGSGRSVGPGYQGKITKII